MENFQNDCCCSWTKKPFKNSYSRQLRIVNTVVWSPAGQIDWLKSVFLQTKATHFETMMTTGWHATTGCCWRCEKLSEQSCARKCCSASRKHPSYSHRVTLKYMCGTLLKELVKSRTSKFWVTQNLPSCGNNLIQTLSPSLWPTFASPANKILQSYFERPIFRIQESLTVFEHNKNT